MYKKALDTRLAKFLCVLLSLLIVLTLPGCSEHAGQSESAQSSYDASEYYLSDDREEAYREFAALMDKLTGEDFSRPDSSLRLIQTFYAIEYCVGINGDRISDLPSFEEEYLASLSPEDRTRFARNMNTVYEAYWHLHEFTPEDLVAWDWGVRERFVRGGHGGPFPL